MKALYFIACAEILIYLALTIINFGIPKSISDTYYQWKEKGFEYLFTFVMWATGIPLLIYWVDIAPNAAKFLPFLSVSGMCFVGAACAFKKNLTAEVHYTSAAIWATAALVFFIVMQNWGAIIVGATFGFITCMTAIAKKSKTLTFWLECACVLMMIVGCELL